MTRRQLAWFSVLVVLVLAAAGCGGATDGGVDAGQRIGDFEMTLLDGSTARLSQWQGRPVVLNFWASWCAPCRAEMPELIKAYETHRDDGLVVVGINVQESEDKARSFVDEFDVPFTIAMDVRGELLNDFQVRGLPTTLFINREGEIVVRWPGLLTAELLEQHLAETLAKG